MTGAVLVSRVLLVVTSVVALLVLVVVTLLVPCVGLSFVIDCSSVILRVLMAAYDLLFFSTPEYSSCELLVSLRVCMDYGFSVWPSSVPPSSPGTLVSAI